jgi:hypothetical protein
MGVVFKIPHKLDMSPARHNWLWYSHGSQPPTDRQVVSGWQDPKSPGIRMAPHYFLTDMAHQMLPSGYDLVPQLNQMWELRIKDNAEAAMFKLTFL